jgi:hypothetical protein
MNIIIATGSKPPYIAGIFQDWAKAVEYMMLKPNSVVGATHVNSIEAYPFYIVETGAEFYPFQELLGAKAFCCKENKACILYTITCDYTPSSVWQDESGRLEHIHFDCDEC